MSRIYIYLYSPSKNQYFYINEKVKDTRTNEEGIIAKIQKPLNSINTEPLIEVKYTNKRVGYTVENQIYLESI